MKRTWFSILTAALVVTFAAQPALRAPGGDSTPTVSCKKMGGAVQFKVQLDGANFCALVTYPKPIASYLGGFDNNGGKTLSARVKIYLDTDANPKTGLKGGNFDPGAKGAEYSIEADEIQTALGKDDKGGWISGPELDAAINKGEDRAELPEGVFPKWETEAGGKFQPIDWIKPPDSKTMRVCAPLSALGLKAGQKIRVSGVVPLCNDAFPFPGVAEATIVLK